MTKKYIIRAENRPLEVEKRVYRAYYGMKRKEKTLLEKDQRNEVVLYSNLDTEDITGEEMIPDTQSQSVEDLVVDKLMIEKLHSCINLLEPNEKDFIVALYFLNKTQEALAEEMGINQSNISRRTNKILEKLKKLMKF